MFSILKESALWTFLIFKRFFQGVWFGIIALTEWLKGFSFIDQWFFTFLLPKLAIIFIGSLSTHIPLWILLIVSFMPIPIVGPLFFVAFIVMLAH
jgi:hypothetical protein